MKWGYLLLFSLISLIFIAGCSPTGEAVREIPSAGQCKSVSDCFDNGICGPGTDCRCLYGECTAGFVAQITTTTSTSSTSSTSSTTVELECFFASDCYDKLLCDDVGECECNEGFCNDLSNDDSDVETNSENCIDEGDTGSGSDSCCSGLVQSEYEPSSEAVSDDPPIHEGECRPITGDFVCLDNDDGDCDDYENYCTSPNDCSRGNECLGAGYSTKELGFEYSEEFCCGDFVAVPTREGDDNTEVDDSYTCVIDDCGDDFCDYLEETYCPEDCLADSTTTSTTVEVWFTFLK